MDVGGNNEEESVEALIAKLNSKGAKVKLLSDEEEEVVLKTPIKTPGSKTPTRTPGKTPTKNR